MQVIVNIQLAKNDAPTFSSDEAAEKIFAALECDPEKDYCTVAVILSPEPSVVGTPPAPPEPFFQQSFEPPPA